MSYGGINIIIIIKIIIIIIVFIIHSYRQCTGRLVTTYV